MSSGSDAPKSHHVSVRVDRQTNTYLEGLAEDWGVDSKSEALRLIIKSHNGMLTGSFFGIVNNDRLVEEWGDVGHLLAAASESERGVPGGVDGARLVDVVEPLPVLVSAADVEAGIVNPDLNGDLGEG